MKKFILFFVLLSNFAFGQITITKSDIEQSFALNKTQVTKTDTTISSIDIGIKGENVWDFSNLGADITVTATSIPVAGTLYAANFPTAAYVFFSNHNMFGIPTENWEYFNFADDNLNHLGGGSREQAPSYSITTRETYTPSMNNLDLPLTSGTNWNYSGTNYSLTIFAGIPDEVTLNTEISFIVDAFGTMKTPDGITEDALRIREDEKNYGEIYPGFYTYDRFISYSFIGRSGSFVLVTTDTTAAEEGTIPVNEASWVSKSGTSDVEDNLSSPYQFSLNQNYPNPFNPATIISYQIPELSVVQLNIYDLLGNKVAELVNQEQTEGKYQILFDASNLSSGIYFYKIQTEKFSETKKMCVIK